MHSSKIVPITESMVLTDPHSEQPKSKYLEVWKRAHIRILTSIRIGNMINNIKQLKSDSPFNTELKTIMFQSTLFETQPSIYQPKLIPTLIFHPNEGFKGYWNVFLGLCLVYTAVATPFLLAFIQNNDFDEWFIIDLVLSGVFLFDFILSLNTAYIDYDGKLITARSKIFFNYLKGWLIIDMTACFPFELLQYFASSNGSRANYNNISKLIRLKNIPRLLRLSKVLALFKNNKAFPFLDNIYNVLSFSHSAVQLLGTLVMILLSLHIVSCLWYFMARLYDFGPDTWIYRKGMLDSSILDAYITSLYWALTTLSTVGYGDVTPKTTGEVLLAMCWMIVAVYFLSFAISSISSLLSQQDSGRKKLLDKKLAMIDSYSEENKLPKRIKISMQKFIKESCDKKMYSFEEKDELINEFSSELKYEIAINVHRGIYRSFSVFENREERFLYTIIPLMRTESMQINSLVYMEGEQFKNIYFMLRGKVHFEDKNGLKFKVVNIGSYFGDFEVVKEINRMFNVRVYHDSGCWVMGYEVFQKIIEEFPLFYKEFEVDAERRMKGVLLELAEMRTIQETNKIGVKDFTKGKMLIKEEYERILMEMKFQKTEHSDISRIEKKIETCKEAVDRNGEMLENIQDILEQLLKANQ